MNIKVNRGLVSILLATTMGFTLGSCGTVENDDKVYVDSFTFNEVIVETEEDSVTDEVLEENDITLVNPFNGEKEETISLRDAGTYLENLLIINDKLGNIPEVQLFTPDSEYYEKTEEEISTWLPDDVYRLINEAMNDHGDDYELVIQKLSYYKTYLDKELRTNGINIATALLEESIKSEVVDVYGGDYLDAGNVDIHGNMIFYENHKLLFEDSYELSVLDSLYNIKSHPEDYNRIVDYDGVVSVLTETLDLTKDVIYNDFIEDKDKVKSI